MKPIGSIVTITMHTFDGKPFDVDHPPIVAGDGLRTRTGRLYEVIETRGKRLRCRVVRRDTIIDRVFYFFWMPRGKR